LKSLITICIAVSLFGPTVAKWMTYADCMFKAQNSLQICDCAKIVSAVFTDTSAKETSQLKDISAKTDWILIHAEVFSTDFTLQQTRVSYNLFSFYIPTTLQNRIFRPPCLLG
jgi:hypothetical protein